MVVDIDFLILLVDCESMLSLRVVKVTKIGFNYIVGWLWEYVIINSDLVIEIGFNYIVGWLWKYVVINGDLGYWNWVFGIVDWDLLRLVEVIEIC